jgi:hypothetical protein
MAKRCRLIDLQPYSSDRPNATLSRQARQPAGSKIWIFDGLVPWTTTGGNELQVMRWPYADGAGTGCSAPCLHLVSEPLEFVDSVPRRCRHRHMDHNMVVSNTGRLNECRKTLSERWVICSTPFRDSRLFC